MKLFEKTGMQTVNKAIGAIIVSKKTMKKRRAKSKQKKKDPNDTKTHCNTSYCNICMSGAP